MKLLDVYLARSVLSGILLALLIICALDWLGDLFYQAGRMGRDDTFSSLLLVAIVDIPYRLFEFLPSALLIGALFSLGQFAASAELAVIGASGYSRGRVGLTAALAGLLVIVPVSLLVELYAPVSEKLRLSILQQEDKNILLAADDSYWVRDQKRFIRVGQAVSQDLLTNISIYSFDADHNIVWIGEAQAALRQAGQWSLRALKSSWFNSAQVTVNNRDHFPVPELFLSGFLQLVSTDPFKMSLKRLNAYIVYLQQNRLDAQAYRVALYKKLALPFTGLAMLLLALPLVFRPRQLGGVGQRLFIGMVMALFIHMVIEAITDGVLVYQAPAGVAAFLPPGLILLCALAAFRFTR